MAEPSRCVCESLESRQLFAGVGYSHGILIVAGVPLEPNTITVGLTPDQQSITATLSFPTPRSGTQVISKTFPRAKVLLLAVVGGALADQITIDQTNGSFPIRSRIYTAFGNDTVNGGDESDTIWGNFGNDQFFGGAGNDVLFSVVGSSTLVGGDGNDVLRGGRGIDSLDGGNGNDALITGRSGQTLIGGAGNNYFFLLTLLGNPHNDFVLGKDRFFKVTPVTTDSNSFLTGIENLVNPFAGF